MIQQASLSDSDAGLVPPVLLERVGAKCATECKGALVPVYCGSYCAKDACWDWCRRLVKVPGDEQRWCVQRCFNGSTTSRVFVSALEPEGGALPEEVFRGPTDASAER